MNEDVEAMLRRFRGREIKPWMVESVAKALFRSRGFAGRPVAWESDDWIASGVRWGEAGRERVRAEARDLLRGTAPPAAAGLQRHTDNR